MTPTFHIGNRQVDADSPTYFIADVAANHDGDIGRAKELIWRAAEAGADAAKFQNFSAATIVSDFGFKALGGQKSHQAAWKKSVYDVYVDASVPLEWTRTLFDTCVAAKIDYFTTPYDLDMIDVLAPYVCAWKIGSGDITWHEAIDRLAETGKPLMLATGASTQREVDMAVDHMRERTNNFLLMQCNTNYTASVENFHHIALNVLKTYATRYPDVVLGLSDHTPGHATVLGAVALGARAVEKHFTDDTRRSGPDHAFSMNPASWREMVDRTRELEAALGPTEKRVMDNELETAVLQRRAVRTRCGVARGEVLRAEHLVMLRPCPSDALPPYRVSELIGKVAGREIASGDCVRLADID